MQHKHLVILVATIVLVATSSSCSFHIGKSEEPDLSKLSYDLTIEQSDKILKTGDYLPVGSIVQLKGAVNKAVIIGVLHTDPSEPNRIYDYAVVAYPVGYLSSGEVYLKDKEDITQIYYLGYVTDDQISLNKRIQEVMATESESRNSTIDN